MDGNYFTTVEKVQQLGNLNSVPEDKIEPHFTTAKIDVIDEIGQDKYDEIYGLGNDGSEAYANLKTAESYMCLKYVVVAINTQSSGNGITKSAGTGDGKQEVLSEADVKDRVAMYNSIAMKILKRYITPTDSDGDGKDDIVNSGSIQWVAI